MYVEIHVGILGKRTRGIPRNRDEGRSFALDDGNDGSMIFESDITFDDFDIISNFEV